MELQCPIEVAQKAIKFVVLSCFSLVKGLLFFSALCEVRKATSLTGLLFMYSVSLQLQQDIAMH